MWHGVIFLWLFVCFGAILILSHSICGPSIVVIDYYWMETWIEGRIKARGKKEKELRKWVKEQQEKRCQYVISPGDWTKIEGRVPFFLGLSHLVPVHLQCVGACVCVYCIRLCSVLCHFSVLTFIYTSNMLKFSYRRDFSMCIQMWGCRRLCVCGCIHACLYVGVFSSLHLVRWWFTGLRD